MDLAKSFADKIADYREGEIPQRTPKHVERWIQQFPEAVQKPILKELNHVFENTYITRDNVEQFLTRLAVNEKLCGNSPKDYWKNAGILCIQQGGNSQKEMLSTFGNAVKEKLDLDINECDGKSNTFIYLDDGVFSGNRILNDLRAWIASDAPKECVVNVLVIVLHAGGQWYATKELKKTCKEVGKSISFKWWRLLEIEDRRTYTDSSDVLRPTSLPDDEETNKYLATLSYPQTYRQPGSIGGNKFFSSEEGRNLLEQELLKAGVKIRTMPHNFSDYHRPLGYGRLQTFGFGSLFVTYRNCPNNTPLAFWASNPWIPLFPRKIN